MRVHVGTSGWQYRDWRDAFYPEGLPQRSWLEHYAHEFACVEVNNTFYNLPTENAVRGWHERTPGDFEFVLKASRYLTHIRRLREPDEPVQTMLERFHPLGRRWRVMLLQLPPRFGVDVPRLEATLRAFPRRLRLAVEFRDSSWFCDEVRAVLRAHGAALCMTDRRGESPEPGWFDAAWTYVRFHEGDGDPYPCYRAQTLRRWAARLAEQASSIDDAYVFFNNDPRCCAPRDAAVFADACETASLEVTRAPEPRSVRLAY